MTITRYSKLKRLLQLQEQREMFDAEIRQSIEIFDFKNKNELIKSLLLLRHTVENLHLSESYYNLHLKLQQFIKVRI